MKCGADELQSSERLKLRSRRKNEANMLCIIIITCVFSICAASLQVRRQVINHPNRATCRVGGLSRVIRGLKHYFVALKIFP